MYVIPALGRWRQEECEFKSSLCYTGRSCLKKITSSIPMIIALLASKFSFSKKFYDFNTLTPLLLSEVAPF
jgi:hypothetical protein